MLGDLLFEGLALGGEWVLDRIFGDDEDDDEETAEQSDEDTAR